MRCPELSARAFLAWVLCTWPVTAMAVEFTEAIVGDAMPGWEVVGGNDQAWSIEDGVLVNPGGFRGGGYMATREHHSDFIIELEYKIAPGGNSGVFLHAPDKGRISARGFEIQILDDEADKHQGLDPAQYNGSVYGIAAPSKRAARPAGEWNHMRVTADGDHVIVDINGETVVDVDGRSHPEILSRRQSGRIGLQNYGVPVSFRNIKVADLNRGQPRPEWITSDQSGVPLFRREFHLSDEPKRAVIDIVGLGHFQLQVNGRRAGDAAIRQPWSQYDKTIYVERIDIAPLLREGGNAIGVMLGNSFWHNRQPPEGRYWKACTETDFGTQYLLRARAVIETDDGERVTVVSDGDWRTSSGPVTFSHIFGGEDYDARLWPAGWDEPGFDDGDWSAAKIEPDPPQVDLPLQFWPPIREKEVFPAVEYVKIDNGVYDAFFGQNASAVLRFTVQGKAGQRFCVHPSEYRTPDGKFMKPAWGDPALFHYTLGGDEPETHQWLFHYHGFEAARISGAVPAGEPNPDDLPVLHKLEMVHVRTDLPTVGTFACSSDIYDRTHTLIDWAMRSNMTYVLTDCPHREKLGWLECAHLLAPTFFYRYDCRDWYAKIARDIREAQQPSGQVFTVAPDYPHFPPLFRWTVEWGAAGALVPWNHYVWYGDKRILIDNYDCMKRFVDYVASVSEEGIAPGGLGDWYDYGHGKTPGPSRFTPTDLTATAVQVMCIDAVIDAAIVLKRDDDAKRYRSLRDSTAAAFLNRFYHADRKQFENTGSCQCANTIALAADLVPENEKQGVLEAVIADLAARDWQQTPGDVGHVYFIRALAEAGRSDLLHKVYLREGMGSYAGILAKGMTAMPETWDAMVNGRQSLNHCMLGHVMEWYYGYVAGIRQAPGRVGWKRLVIGPEPGPLDRAEAVFDSPAGRITSKWTVQNSLFALEVDLPDGTTAEVITPDGHSHEAGPGHHVFRCGYRPGR